MAKLRAVGPDEQAEQARTPPLGLAEAVETGDPLTIALAQRRDIVRKLKDAGGPAAAALHRQLSLTSERITELEQAAMVEQVDGGGSADRVDDSFDASAI